MSRSRMFVSSVLALVAVAAIAIPVYAHCGKCAGSAKEMASAMDAGRSRTLDPHGSAVTISISSTRMAVESYGYMAPAKAALDSAVAFLAKSFSRFSQVRFNAVAAGLLKTSASAGIPGYIDNYMFAEQAIPRKSGLTTDEVASAALFLLSPRSSGINAQSVVVDAGMGINFFDADVVRHTLQGIWPAEGPQAT